MRKLSDILSDIEENGLRWKKFAAVADRDGSTYDPQRADKCFAWLVACIQKQKRLEKELYTSGHPYTVSLDWVWSSF